MSGKLIKTLGYGRFRRFHSTSCHLQIGLSDDETHEVLPRMSNRPSEASETVDESDIVHQAVRILGAKVIEVRSLRPEDNNNPVNNRQNRKDANG